MMRTIDVCDKNIFPEDPNIVAVLANTPTTILPDVTKNSSEYAYRVIMNVGANNAFYCFDQTCDGTNNYNGYLIPGQQVNCPGCVLVSCFSVGGTTIATTVFKRIGL